MTEDDDLVLLGPLDQDLPANEKPLLELVERRIQIAIDAGKPYDALDVCKALRQAQKIAGIGLASALFLIRKNWDKFNVNERFDDVAWTYVGIHKHTLDRYIKVADMLNAGYVPEGVRDDLKQRNIKDLIPIANAVAEGTKINEQQWEELAHAPDSVTVGKIVREIKGAEPRSSAMMLSVDEMGSIWCFKGGNRYFVGSLEVGAEEPPIQQAITRIINNSGILRT